MGDQAPRPGRGTAPVEEVEFTLDGRAVRARKGEMLIAAAERAGTFIPASATTPHGVRRRLPHVPGRGRGPRGATLMPGCFIEATPGMEVVTDSDKVKKAQDGVLEFLLINHPLDCPVCDKGGECPLQDQTLAYGPGETRFVEEKRHFEKPVPISELVLLDRERCIQCSRCTRFAAEVAGEAQIDFIGRGEQLQVATFPELALQLVLLGQHRADLPGGRTHRPPYRFAARPWDLDQVESTCTTCSVGCRVAVQSSANRLTRLLGIDIDPVNHGWLCDKGRFAADAVNAEDRLTEPMVRKDGALVAVSWHEALEAAAAGLAPGRRRHRPRSVAVVGGARLTNEGAYAWARVAKGVLGTDSVDAQLGDGLPAEPVLGLPRATIDQAASAATVVLLTGTCAKSFPCSSCVCGPAAVDGDLSIVELSPQATSLTAHAAASLRSRPAKPPALVDALVSGGRHRPAPPTRRAGRPGAWSSDGPRGRGGGPAVAGRGRRVGGRRRAALARPCPSPLPARPSPRQRARRPRHGPRPRCSAGPGLASRTAGTGPRPRGARSRPPRGPGYGRHPGRRGRRPAGRGWRRSYSSGPIPWATSRTGASPPRRSRGPGSSWRWDRACRRPRARRRRAAVRQRARAPRTTTNIEGRVSRLGQKLVPPGQSWPDRMIAAELASRLGSDLGLRHGEGGVGRDRAPRTFPP